MSLLYIQSNTIIRSYKELSTVLRTLQLDKMMTCTVDCERIQGVINLADTLDHLCQFALQFQHERVEVFWQLSYKTYSSHKHIK